MSKILFRKITNCHNCPRLSKTTSDIPYDYKCEVPKTFKYVCRQYIFTNAKYVTALTTQELFDKCPLPDVDELITKSWAFRDEDEEFFNKLKID